MPETSTDLEVREQRPIALIDSGAFRERVEPLLPDTIPFRRFAQLAKTAIRTRPELVDADSASLFNALIRCASDGLYPDGREAALNVYNSKAKQQDGSEVWVKKVEYLPMIGGLRKRLAEYGWTLKTRVVFANDDFSYSEEPPELRHVPVRPGAERGDRIAAYAVATHTDGRRLQIVLHPAEIAARKAKARTDKVWNEWTDAMWEKSAGHAIYDEIPKAERDRMRIPSEDTTAEAAVELLYGPDGTEFTATPALERADVPAEQPDAAEPEHQPSRSGPGTDGDGQQDEPAAEADRPAAGSSPGPSDDEPEPGSLEELGQVVIPTGTYKTMTLAAVAALEADAGVKWFIWALPRPKSFDPVFYGQMQAFVERALPEVWEQHSQRAAA